MKNIKNFQKMDVEEFCKSPARIGRIKATKYSYCEIVGAEQIPNHKQLRMLQQAMDLVASELDDPFLLLLMLEFGSSECTLVNFCVQYRTIDAEDYLLNTPFGTLEMDYRQACSIIREVYNMD